MIYNLGIGDILLTKLIFETNNIEQDFNIYKPIIDQYRNGSEEYLKFTIKLSKTLFGNNSGNIIYNAGRKFCNTNYKIGHVNLSNYLNIKKMIDEKYIIFHTKARFDYQKTADFYKKNELPLFRNFLKDFKSEKRILLLGERVISPNKSTTVKNQFTIYEDLLLLKNNNEVLDLTNETLNNSPSWDIFERDMSYINGADLNIGFGYGGNAISCFSFSKKNCFFISRIDHPLLKYFSRFTHTKMDLFLEQIKKEKTNV